MSEDSDYWKNRCNGCEELYCNQIKCGNCGGWFCSECIKFAKEFNDGQFMLCEQCLEEIKKLKVILKLID